MRNRILDKAVLQTALVALMMAFVIGPLHATIIKTEMATLLKSVTPVPKTAQVAHSRCAKNDGNLAVIGSIQAFKDKLDEYKRINDEPYPTDDSGTMTSDDSGESAVDGTTPGSADPSLLDPTGQTSAMDSTTGTDKKTASEKIKSRKDLLQKKIDTTKKRINAINEKRANAVSLLEQKCNRLIAELEALATGMKIDTKVSALNSRFKTKHDQINADTETAKKTCPAGAQGTEQSSITDKQTGDDGSSLAKTLEEKSSGNEGSSLAGQLRQKMSDRKKISGRDRKSIAEHKERISRTDDTAGSDTGSLSATDTPIVPDGTCVKRKESAAAERHITAANGSLGELGKIMTVYSIQLKPLVIRADVLLAQVKYGDLVDIKKRAPFNTLQGLVLQHIMLLQTTAMDACVREANWVEKKRNISTTGSGTAPAGTN